jgi:phosphoribosyl 1,2-cyclic phosphodiesterase
VRATVLASGSAGNALLVESAGACVLIDCGLSLRSLQQRMRAHGLEPDCIDAVLVTHEHGDHVRGLAMVLRRLRVPVLATAGTTAALALPGVEAGLAAGRPLRFGGLTVLPVEISHDAAEPVGFVVDDGVSSVGVVTDTGVLSPALLERLAGCSALLLECNHDPDMLRLGPYPWPLKQRILSRTGHLSNTQTRDAVEVLAHAGLETVVGMHLSRENNLPALVRRELERPLAGSGISVAVADQDVPVQVEVGRRPAADAGRRV